MRPFANVHAHSPINQKLPRTFTQSARQWSGKMVIVTRVSIYQTTHQLTTANIQPPFLVVLKKYKKKSQEFKLMQLSTDNQLCNRSTTQQYIHYWFTIHLPLYICISYNRAQSCNDMSDVRTWSHVSTTLRKYRELEISDRKTCCFAMHCCSIMHCTVCVCVWLFGLQKCDSFLLL